MQVPCPSFTLQTTAINPEPNLEVGGIHNCNWELNPACDNWGKPHKATQVDGEWFLKPIELEVITAAGTTTVA